ncbi:MAG: phosphotransferase family protein [Halioglobus sp.]
MAAQTFADWADQTLGLSNARIARTLAGGNSNLTRLVETDQRTLVMRSAPANTISPKAHLGVQREASVMKALHQHVKVPEVVHWCDDTSVIGHPFALIEHINGVSITDELPTSYQGVAAVNQLGEQLAAALATIAKAPWQDIGLEKLGRPENFLQRQIERWLEVRRQKATRPLPEIESLGIWLLDNIPKDGPVGIVHGDYHLDNTLCSSENPELLAVIDWEMATVGDPLTDLGLFLMFWGPRAVTPPGFKHVQGVTRLTGAIPRRELAQQWQEQSGITCDALEFYLCFAFWRLAAVVEGAYGLYLDGKVDSDYARGLEHDVPALLKEAQLAAEGDW